MLVFLISLSSAYICLSQNSLFYVCGTHAYVYFCVSSGLFVCIVICFPLCRLFFSILLFAWFVAALRSALSVTPAIFPSFLFFSYTEFFFSLLLGQFLFCVSFSPLLASYHCFTLYSLPLFNSASSCTLACFRLLPYPAWSFRTPVITIAIIDVALVLHCHLILASIVLHGVS